MFFIRNIIIGLNVLKIVLMRILQIARYRNNNENKKNNSNDSENGNDNNNDNEIQSQYVH